MNPIQTIREALELATPHYQADTERFKQALTSLAEIERTHYTAEDVADASAQGFRDGVASVTAEQGQEPVAWMYDWLPAGGPTAYDWISGSKAEVFAPENCYFNIRPLYAAPVAQQPQEPDWKHPKIQALIGADARNRIVIDLIWQILKDPEGNFSAMDMEYWDSIHDAVQAAVMKDQQPQAEVVQACGHSMSLLLRSAESNEPLYCEACDDKSGRHDAERRETELLDANRRLQEKIGSADALKLHAIEELCQLGYTVKGGELFPPDHLHKLMEAAEHPLAAPQQAEAVAIQECYGDCPTNPATCANPCKFNGRPVPKRATGWVAPKDRYTTPVLFNPYTGEPRDVRDVQSDPQGILIVPPGAMLAAAPKGQP